MDYPPEIVDSFIVCFVSLGLWFVGRGGQKNKNRMEYKEFRMRSNTIFAYLFGLQPRHDFIYFSNALLQLCAIAFFVWGVWNSWFGGDSLGKIIVFTWLPFFIMAVILSVIQGLLKRFE